MVLIRSDQGYNCREKEKKGSKNCVGGRLNENKNRKERKTSSVQPNRDWAFYLESRVGGTVTMLRISRQKMVGRWKSASDPSRCISDMMVGHWAVMAGGKRAPLVSYGMEGEITESTHSPTTLLPWEVESTVRVERNSIDCQECAAQLSFSASSHLAFTKHFLQFFLPAVPWVN